MIKEIIQLYDQYLSETIEERTILLTCLEDNDKNYGKQQPRVIKGNLDGFINWLRNKNDI